MRKVVIKILEGRVVIKTVLGGLTIDPPVVNFLQCTCTKNYESWLAVGKVIAIKISSLLYLGSPGESASYMLCAVSNDKHDQCGGKRSQ